MLVLIGVGILLFILACILIVKDALVNTINAIRKKEKLKLSSIEVLLILCVVLYVIYLVVKMVINDNN